MLVYKMKILNTLSFEHFPKSLHLYLDLFIYPCLLSWVWNMASWIEELEKVQAFETKCSGIYTRRKKNKVRLQFMILLRCNQEVRDSYRSPSFVPMVT
jgi:hypothetical protein